jgi:hypothetical protein
MPRTFVVDSTNTSRLAKRIFVVDSTNTPRQLKRAFVIDSTNTARLVYTAAVTMTMVAGSAGVGQNTFGYDTTGPNGPYGSLTPHVDPAGNEVTAIAWGGASGAVLTLNISVTPNPGQFYVYSLAITPGDTLLATASNYAYAGGTAIWTWGGYPGITFGDTYTCVLTL